MTSVREVMTKRIGTLSMHVQAKARLPRIAPKQAAIFAAVVDAGSISAAARALALPKSAVSAAVAALERDVGVKLLHRTARAALPTEAGNAFYAHATAGLAAFDAAVDAAHELQHALRGPIRISAPVETGTLLLASLVSAFLGQHPAVTIDVVLTARAVDMIAEGVDLALRGGPIRDPSLVARSLGTTDAGLYAAPSWLAARQAIATAHDVQQAPAVLLATQSSTWTLEAPQGRVTIEVQPRLRADYFSFVREAVVAGVGVGLLPALLCRADVQAGALVRVLPEVAWRGAPFSLVYPSGRLLPARVAALRDALLVGLVSGPLGQGADQGRGVSRSKV